MSRRLDRWRPGLLAALFALAAQILFGAAAPDMGVRATPEQQLAALLADPAAICHGDTGGGQQTPHHHAVDCLLCPYCAAIASAAMLRSDDPTLPIPRATPIAVAIVTASVFSRQPARLLAAQPRGPPILA